MFTDFFQNTITDVGAIGPDRARGGLYLLLPPGYKGEVPKGYFAFESKTNYVFLFFRTIMKKGENGPDPAPAVALAERTRVYPLWTMEKDVKPMIFPDGSGKRLNMMYPTDASYWTKLKAFVDYEPDSAIEPMLRGTLAAIGIVKGQPFAPTEKQQELLKKAVETAPKMILATRQLGRPDKRNLYYTDRQWQNAWAGATSEWLPGQLSRFHPALDLLPGRLFFGPGDGHADDRRRLEISVHFPRRGWRFHARIGDLQAASAAEPACGAVLGHNRLQYHRRHDD